MLPSLGVETADKVADILFCCGGQRFVYQELGELLCGEHVANSGVLGFSADQQPSPKPLNELIVIKNPADGLRFRVGQLRESPLL
jgi:hypothetical protein